MQQKFYQVSAYEKTFSKKTRSQEFTFAKEGLFEIYKNKNILKVNNYTVYTKFSVVCKCMCLQFLVVICHKVHNYTMY